VNGPRLYKGIPSFVGLCNYNSGSPNCSRSLHGHNPSSAWACRSRWSIISSTTHSRLPPTKSV